MGVDLPPVTVLLITLITSIFWIHYVTGLLKPQKHTLKPEHGFDWETDHVFSFITSSFVHKSFLYLFASVITLGLLGSRLETKLGSILFSRLVFWVWFGSLLLFCALGGLLYFFSGYSFWLKVKHTGFAGILTSLAICDAYIGKKRELVFMVLPWLLVPIVPLFVPRVSLLSLFSAALFGLLLVRTRLGLFLLPSREKIVKLEETSFTATIVKSWSSFVGVWLESEAHPFEDSMKGGILTEVGNGTVEEIRPLIPLSSNNNKSSTISAPQSQGASVV